MREVSTLEKNAIQESPYRLAVGQYAECSTQPDKAVKAYPKLNSKHPLYGTLLFDRDISTGKSNGIHFVLDESGETPPVEEKQEKKDAEKVAKQKTSEKARPASPKPSSYDRLYIDANRDLDLTNDPVVKPMKDPPWQALPPWQLKERAAFDYVNINVDYGPGVGVRPFRVLPWLTGGDVGGENTSYMMHFVATVARQGRIRIGKHECDALLAQPHLVRGRFDRPMTSLYLKPLDSKVKLNAGGFSGEMLSTVQRVDGRLYTFSATPLGDKLTVKPYRGDFGIFKLGLGGRKIKDIGFSGSLQSETMAIGIVPDRTVPEQKQKKLREYQVPVGDYTPSYLVIEYGRLQLSLSENYHSDGRPRSFDRPRTCFHKNPQGQAVRAGFLEQARSAFRQPREGRDLQAGRRSQREGGSDRPEARHHDPSIGRYVAEEEGNDPSGIWFSRRQAFYRNLRAAAVARSDRDDHRLVGQEDRRGPDALWLRRHVWVLVASTEGSQTGRQERNVHRNGARTTRWSFMAKLKHRARSS